MPNLTRVVQWDSLNRATSVFNFREFLPWEIQVSFPGESQLRQLHYPSYCARWMFQCFHNTSNSDMVHGIFNVHMDTNACDCTQGCVDTVRESALKADSGSKIPCCNGGSNLPQRRAGPTLYQLSYIPAQHKFFFFFTPNNTDPQVHLFSVAI